MASELRVNTLKDASGNNSVATSTVAQGSAKAWHKAQNNATLDDSFNISSGSDQGTGNYDYSFTNSMNNANYSITCSGSYAEIGEPEQSSATASQYTVRTFGRQDSLNNADQRQSAQIAGDLA
jgi:hypothetical protein